ncbi:hypothetical protein ACFCV9_12780 [Streptomyces sp. NPDC056367]|uniref:hypothetical protein n=1 Tax=Streptomyces sp. NPDC056367 TaxID=3345797 RepID=UPI0035DE2C6C
MADDVDAVEYELYGLAPAQFTAARDALAARARKAGDGPAAKRITALRKPTLAVWAANLLARADPGQADRLLELGRQLREAHRMLAGPELRELSHRQHRVIEAMAREASRLAGEAGQAVSEDVRRGVEEILHSVLADPGTAATWARGVLAQAPPRTVGFAGLEPAPGATPGPPRRAAGTPADGAGRTTASRAEAERRAREQKRARVKAEAEAQAEADRAGRAAEQAEEAVARAERELTRARAELEALDGQITGLRHQLDQARKGRSRLDDAVQAAVRDHRQADRDAKNARTAARKAQGALQALEDPSRSG